MPKVLLVKPFNISDHIQPSLGLGYLANSIRNFCDVNILDCIKERLNLVQFINHIKRNPPDILGFQFYTYDYNFIKTAVVEIKKHFPEIIIVVGGPHPSVCGEDILNQIPEIDFAFKGEAEKSMPIFLDLISKKEIDYSKVKGLVYRKDGKILSNSQEFYENLDELGLPAWDLIRPETYPEAQHGAFFKNFPIAPIITSRGCPFSCSFCAAHTITGKKFRARSPEHVIKEIELLYTKYRIREIHFVDDNFTLNKERTKRILKLLKESKLRISWAVPNGIRIGTLDAQLLQLMRDTGCYLISIGIESGSDRILSYMKKNFTVATIRHEIKFIKSFGFDIAGFFILGFPTETEEDIKKTIELALELPLMRANFFTFLPLPGTEAYKELENSGELNNVDWNKFLFTAAPYVPKGLTRRKLRNLQREAFLRFFLRPKIIVKNITQIKSFGHLYFLTKRAFHWLM